MDQFEAGAALDVHHAATCGRNYAACDVCGHLTVRTGTSPLKHLPEQRHVTEVQRWLAQHETGI